VTAASGRVTGVETNEGTLAAGAVVLAAGAWTGQVAVTGAVPLPSHPVRGQILCLASDGGAPRHVLVTRDHHYLVPRSDGRILIGSTMERVGFDTSVTASALAKLAATAIGEVPGLAEARFHSAWAGLRPATPDGLPAIGRGEPRGLWYACGHLRNGILLAPITAQAIVGMVCGEAPGVDLSGCEPARLTRPFPVADATRVARPDPRPVA